MASVVCPLCSGNDYGRLFTDHGHDLVVCRQCELLFITPYPDSSSRVHEQVEEYRYDELQVVNAEQHHAEERTYYQRYFPLIHEECRGARAILDVGCGTGHLLQLLGQQTDAFRAGIELNAERAALARRIAGCEIHQVPIEAFQADRQFDVIILFNVLSHIPSFDDLFGKIRNLLSPQGKVIIKVCEMRRDVQKGALFGWGIPDHLHFLGFRTLAYIAGKYGLQISRHDVVPFASELFTAARWRTPGASRFRNFAKTVIASMPFALPVLRHGYDTRYGGMVNSSFIVLQLDPSATSAAP